jgi:hypothetical protein
MLLGQLSWIARSRRCRAGCRLSAICQQFVRERGEIRPYGAPQDNGSVVQNPLSSRLNVTRRHSPRRTESGVQVPPPTLGSLQKPWSEACGGGGGPVSGMSSIASCLHTGRSKPQNWCRSGSSDTSFVGWRSSGPASAPLSTRRRVPRRVELRHWRGSAARPDQARHHPARNSAPAPVAETVRPMAGHRGISARRNGDRCRPVVVELGSQ